MSWLIIFTFIACKNNKEEKKSDPVRTSAASYLTNDDILNLSNSADYVDMLFYHMNIGRISFLSKGKIIREADIHLSPGCNYFTIIENKVSSGTVLMSPEGVKFLQALIDSYKPQ